VSLALPFGLFDTFAARTPLIEARGCSAYWEEVIGRNISSIRRVVITRAYTACAVYYGVERIE